MIGVRRAHDAAVVVNLCDMRTQLGRILMGAKDVREKHLFSKNDVFSSVWNELDGDGDVQTPGTVWLEPENLLEVSPEIAQILDEHELHRFRDIFKLYKDDFGLSVALFGLENQTDSDKRMAARVMLYDALGYYAQVEELKPGKKVVPIFTRVLYFGYNTKWSAPRKLSELCVVPSKLASRFQDYHIEVIELAWLSDEQIERLTGDLKVLAVFLRKMRLKQLNDWPKLKITYVPEVLGLLHEITGHERFKQEKCNFANLQRSMTMCDLFEKHDSALIEKGKKLGLDEGKKLGLDEGKKLGLDEGEKLGLAKGKTEGKAEMASSIARNLIAMRMPEDDIAKATGLSIDQVQALIAS